MSSTHSGSLVLIHILLIAMVLNRSGGGVAADHLLSFSGRFLCDGRPADVLLYRLENAIPDAVAEWSEPPDAVGADGRFSASGRLPDPHHHAASEESETIAAAAEEKGENQPHTVRKRCALHNNHHAHDNGADDKDDDHLAKEFQPRLHVEHRCTVNQECVSTRITPVDFHVAHRDDRAVYDFGDIDLAAMIADTSAVNAKNADGHRCGETPLRGQLAFSAF